MNGTFDDEYCQAACTELETLEVMGAWYVVDSEDDIYFIISTCDFKLNIYSDGFIK